MPALVAPLVVLPAILLYRGTKWVPVALLVVLFVATVANPGWRLPPTEGAPVTLLAAQVLLFIVVVISSYERGWLKNTVSGRAVYAGAFLIAFLIYYLFETQIVRIGPYTSSLVTFILLTALPWLAAWLWQRTRRSQ